MKTLEERKAILDKEIIRQQKNNWRVINRTDTTCQLEINKNPQTCLIIALLLLFILPGILYLIFSKKTTNAFVEVNEQGEIVYSGKDLSPYEIIEANKHANAAASNLIIETKPSASTHATNDLGLLTTSLIANGLNITEEEVINLIETGQLKGKKIGDKFFVMREDFDAFMKI